MVHQMKVIQAINNVMKEVNEIKPTGFNMNLKYTYTTERDVIQSIRESMVTHGLIIFPIATRSARVQENVKITRFDVEVSYRIQHVSGEYIDTTVVVGSSDRNDKGSQKAMVSALKYTLKQVFLLTDQDQNKQKQTTQLKVQIPQFEEWCQKNGGFERILQYCVMNGFGNPLEWSREKQTRFQRAVNEGKIELDYHHE